jgi:DNA-binding NarL/FixJ family response regulator
VTSEQRTHLPHGTRVLVADDDPEIRTGFREILEAAHDLRVVGEAGDGQRAVEEAWRLRPDVVLLDIRMPILDGLTAAERMIGLPTAIIIVTTFGESAYVDRAVQIGVAGFLLKTGGPIELTEGVRAVARGGSCLSPAIARHVMRDLRSARAATDNTTSPELPAIPARHRELLRLLANGFTNAEIAADLHLSEGTVKAYLRELFPRLGVRNRVEAAILARSAAETIVPDPPNSHASNGAEK